MNIELIITQIHNDLVTNMPSTRSNEFNEIIGEYPEYEVRLGKSNEQTFNANIGKNEWLKIFQNLTSNHHNFEKVVICDYIQQNYKKRYQKNIIRYSSEHAKIAEKDINIINNYNGIFKEFEANVCQINTLLKSRIPLNNNLLPYQKFYQKKRINMFTIDNIRYNYNIETYFKYLPNFYATSTNIRYKHRYSVKLNEYIQLEMSIVRAINDYNDSQMNDSDHCLSNKNEYIIELELIDYDANKHNIIMEKWKKAIENIYSIYFNLTHFLLHQRVIHSKTIKKNNLIFLKEHAYTVTDKADGTRALLIFLKDKVLLQNPINGQIEEHFVNKTTLKSTIIDGEYFKESKKFLAFDILCLDIQSKDALKLAKKNTYAYNSINDVRNSNLLHRINHLLSIEKILQSVDNLSISIKKYYNLSMDAKPSLIYEKAYEIWQKKDSLYPYSIDGLIFAPIDQNYIFCQQKLPIFKWKPIITIDVCIYYDFDTDFTYFYHYNSNNSKFGQNGNETAPWFTTNILLARQMNEAKMGKYIKIDDNKLKYYLGACGKPLNDGKLLKNYQDIVEYGYDYEAKIWHFVALRNENKHRPNNYYTIKNNIEAILNPITIENIQKMSQNEYSYDYINTYIHDDKMSIDKINDANDNVPDTNPNDVKSIENAHNDASNHRKTWRLFNNFVKRQLFKKNINITINNDKNDSNSYDNVHGNDQSFISNYGPNNYNCDATNRLKKPINVHNDHQNVYVWKRKSNHSTNSANHYHLELGCGSLGDLWKFIQCKYKNVLAIDVSRSALNEAKNRLIGSNMFINVNDYWIHQNGLKITLMCADMTLPFKENQQIQEYVQKIPNKAFDSISCMFSLHYALGIPSTADSKIWIENIKKTNQFTSNIDILLKQKGIFFGTYMNSDRVKNDEEVFEMEGHLLFKVEKNKPKDTQNVYKQKILPTFEIFNETWGNNVHMTEPCMNEKVIKNLTNALKLTQIQLESFSTYLAYFKDKLTFIELKLCSLNDVFMYQKP